MQHSTAAAGKQRMQLQGDKAGCKVNSSRVAARSFAH